MKLKVAMKRFRDRFWTITLCLGLINRLVTSSSSFGISSPHPLLPEVVRVATESIPAISAPVAPPSTMVSEESRSPGRRLPANPVELCDKMNLNDRQKRLCNQGGGLPETLLEAISMSASFCTRLFQYERWNCPLDEQRLHTLEKLSRETAALYAFSAAGVEHAVSRACAAGRLKKCHCAEAENMVETRQTWKWGGCGDNLSYGRSFAVKFLDAKSTTPSAPTAIENRPNLDDNHLPVRGKEPKRNATRTQGGRWKRTMSTNTAANRKNELSVPKKNSRKLPKESARQRIDRNNNIVGLQVVEQLVNRTCKCHGVSGSCTMQTCWNQLAAFSDTALVLKLKYEEAARYPEEINDNASGGSKSAKKSKKSPAKNLKNMATQQPGDKRSTSATGKSASKNGNKKKNRKQSASSDELLNQDRLLYLDDSADFCQANQTSPFRGTTGRVCLKGDNCEVLCCGRGYNVHESTVRVPCKCKFVRCCAVKCETCLSDRQIETCK